MRAPSRGRRAHVGAALGAPSPRGGPGQRALRGLRRVVPLRQTWAPGQQVSVLVPDRRRHLHLARGPGAREPRAVGGQLPRLHGRVHDAPRCVSGGVGPLRRR
eukprot:373080-Lingulodinium_polyedra.AAC.1